MKKASEILNKQSSFSQWYAEASPENGKIFKKEDEEKNQRLKVLHDEINLPSNIGLDMPLAKLLALTSDTNLQIAGKPLYEAALGIRLVPDKDSDQLFRTRGKKLPDIKEWIGTLNIETEHYIANLLPHVEAPDFSTIFIVSEKGIKGEAIKGPPHLLTQGFYDDIKPITFYYDFEQLKLSSADDEAEAYLQTIIDRLRLSQEQFDIVSGAIPNLELIKGFLGGYFETVTSAEYGLWFIDFNRYLGAKLDDIIIDPKNSASAEPFLNGLPVSKGNAVGKVVIVPDDAVDTITFNPGDILACKMTTPAYIPLMKAAGAILTQQGGILSHAAIISRELVKPCIAGISGLLSTDINGKTVTVDADSGRIFLSV